MQELVKSKNYKVFTIGHSNHSIDYFFELLDAFSINCIIDVRNVPESRFVPYFGKANLAQELKARDIVYLHFREEFAARRDYPAFLDEDGRIDYEKVRESATFLSGVERLRKGLEKGYCIALMCAEGDPFDCHRFVMISNYLVKNGFTVEHILKDKTSISNEELEKRLLEKYSKKLPVPTLFEPDVTREQQLATAYRLRNQDISAAAVDE